MTLMTRAAICAEVAVAMVFISMSAARLTVASAAELLAPAAPRMPWPMTMNAVVGHVVVLPLPESISRVVVGAHSVSEVVAGLLSGCAVSALTLSYFESAALALRPLVPALLLAWVAVTPFQLQASQTHSLVTRLALSLSGHEAPFTRAKLLHRLRPQST